MTARAIARSRRVTMSIVSCVAFCFSPLNSLLFCQRPDNSERSDTAQPTTQSLTQSQREAFRWFDGLAYPKLEDRQLV
jgi:hypothetical protein